MEKTVILAVTKTKRFEEMTYIETINYLLENTKLSSADIYHYNGKSGGEYFERLFQFYSGNLDYNKKFGANPSYIVFYDREDAYAKAKVSRKHYIIIFDKKLIHQLSKWYNSYFDFGNIEGLEEFNSLEKEISFKISELLEQAIIHFIFYHEFAHLIQFTPDGENEKEEKLSGDCKFEQHKHIEEYDADIFSGICISTHIYQFIDSHLGGNIDNGKLNDFIAIIISGIMAYILTLPMCKEKFYTKEGSHPHNSIRVNYINMAIVQQFKDIISQQEKNITIDENYITGRSFMILNSLLGHFGENDIKTRFSEDLGNNWESIHNYQQELHTFFLEYKMSAVAKWNTV
jgi:hypothetical protein